MPKPPKEKFVYRLWIVLVGMALVHMALAVRTPVVVLVVMAAVFVVRLGQWVAYFVSSLRSMVRNKDEPRCLKVYAVRLVAGQLMVTSMVVAVIVRLSPETPFHQLVMRVAAMVTSVVLP